MPGIKVRRKTWVSTSGDNDYYPLDAEVKKYCMKCDSYGFHYQELGERVYQDEELINGLPPHDADLWLQCYRCGTITPSGHGKQEGHIKGFIDVPDTIHDTADRLKIEHFIEPRRKHKIKKEDKDGYTIALPSNIEEDKDIQNLTKQSGREVANYSDSPV